jgi:hypothetical protein
MNGHMPLRTVYSETGVAKLITKTGKLIADARNRM